MNMNNNDDIQKMFWANDNDKTGILLGDKNIKLQAYLNKFIFIKKYGRIKP